MADDAIKVLEQALGAAKREGYAEGFAAAMQLIRDFAASASATEHDNLRASDPAKARPKAVKARYISRSPTGNCYQIGGKRVSVHLAARCRSRRNSAHRENSERNGSAGDESRRSIGHLEADHKIRRIAGTKTWVYEASAEAGGGGTRPRDPRHRTTHRAGWEMVPRRCIRDVDKSFSRLTLSHGGHERCVADGQVVLRAPAFPTVIQKVRITPALRRRLAFVGAGRLVHRGAGLLSGCMSATWRLASSRAVVCRGYEAMADRALPHWPRRMKAPLAAAYVDDLERALPLRQQQPARTERSGHRRIPADNSMLGMVLLVYDLHKPGLGKLTSGANVPKEKARLEPLVEAAIQAAVEERGRTLDKG